MARILKHEIPTASEFTLPLHEGCRILKLDVVNEKAYIWVLEDESRPQRGVKFRLLATGEEADLQLCMEYVDTFIIYNGSFVGHLFMDTSVPVKFDGELKK